jgi:hypothetical protein
MSGEKQCISRFEFSREFPKATGRLYIRVLNSEMEIDSKLMFDRCIQHAYAKNVSFTFYWTALGSLW